MQKGVSVLQQDPVCFSVMNTYYGLTRTQIIASIVSVIVYGVNIALFATNFHLLRKTRRNAPRSNPIPSFKSLPRRNALLLCYISVMFILSTLMTASLLKAVNEKLYAILFLCNQPNTGKSLEVSMTLGKLGDMAFTIANWGADVMLAWRCLVIYRGSGVPAWVAVPIPTLMVAASIVGGIRFIVATLSESRADIFNFSQITFAMISLALNLLMSALIVGRLLYYRMRMRKVLGKYSAGPYTSIIAMVVESEILIVIFGAAFVSSYFLDKSARYSSSMLQVMSQIQVFAPLVITLGVALGKGWTSEQEEDISTIKIAQTLSDLTVSESSNEDQKECEVRLESI